MEFSYFFGLFMIRLTALRVQSNEFFTAVDREHFYSLASMRHADLPCQFRLPCK